MIKEKIAKDFKEALLARDESRLGVLRLLRAAIKNKEVEKRTKLSKAEGDQDLEKASQLTDEEILEVVSSEMKKRKDAAQQYEQGERPELAQKEKTELGILQKYLPEQLSKEEIRRLAKEAIAKVGASGPQDIGKVMGEMMGQVKGRADGGLVSKVVKEELTG